MPSNEVALKGHHLLFERHQIDYDERYVWD